MDRIAAKLDCTSQVVNGGPDALTTAIAPLRSHDAIGCVGPKPDLRTPSYEMRLAPKSCRSPSTMHESASGQNGWLSGKFEEVFGRQKEGTDHASDAEVAQIVAGCCADFLERYAAPDAANS
jgi:hypothetical protein